MFSIGLNRAVTLLAEKRAGKGGRFGRAAATKTVIKDLGEHPGGGGKIQVLEGRYGPYVNHGKINATVPKGTEPAALTLDEAVRLLQERAAKGGGKKPARGKAAARPKAAKEAALGGEAKAAKAKPKAAAKKPMAKKPATKAKKTASKAKPKAAAES